MNLSESPYQPTDRPTASQNTRLAPGRPTSITVIAWLLIVAGGIALIFSILFMHSPDAQSSMARNPIPISVHYVMLYAGLLTMVVSGVGMLNGQSWGRLLYVISAGIAFLVGIATSPMTLKVLPSLGVFLINVFFLFRPKANQYFSAAEPANDSRDVRPTTQDTISPLESSTFNPDVTEESVVRERWLVFVSLILAILIVLTIEVDVTFPALFKGVQFYLMAKAVVLAVILSPLLLYVWINGWRGVIAARAVIVVIGTIVGLRMMLDVLAIADYFLHQ